MPLNFAPIMPPLQQTLWDKTLDTFLTEGEVNFFIDGTTTPKNVYQLVGTGPGTYTYVSLGHTLTLSGIGTFIDANGGAIEVYLWPWLGSPNDPIPSQIAQNYYITVYSSTGVFQFDLNNIPGVLSGGQPQETTFETTENVISNPEFSEVLFSTEVTSLNPVVFNVTGTLIATEIAPDWSVVTTGSGSISVYQQTIIDETAPGNPAYALGISTSGFTQPIILRQRILTPRIFADEYVSGTFIVQANNGGPYDVTMNYTPSITGTIQQICTGTTVGSGFIRIFNNTPIFITNPGSGSGYIDITLVFPVGASLQISCVQLLGVIDNIEIAEYLQQSPEREADHLFHYWQPKLNFKAIPSYLVGWDFRVNPAQFGNVGTLGALGANTCDYIADQTLLFQTVSDSLGWDAGNATTENKELVVTTTAATQFALIQYLDASALYAMDTNRLSAYIQVSTDATINMNISLWFTTNSTLPNPPVTTNHQTFFSGLDSNGHPTSITSGWTEIPNIYGNANFSSSPHNIGKGFSGWDGSKMVNMMMPYITYFAIVVGTGAVTSGKNHNFSRISLVPGDIPCPPGPQQPDEVLRECQYYYETSYPIGKNYIAPGTASTITMINSAQITTSSQTYPTFLGFNYLVPKRFTTLTSLPITIYSPTTGNAGDVDLYQAGGSAGYSSTVTATDYFNISISPSFPNGWNQYGYAFYSNGTALPKTGSPATIITPYVMSWHHVIDVRLGNY